MIHFLSLIMTKKNIYMAISTFRSKGMIGIRSIAVAIFASLAKRFPVYFCQEAWLNLEFAKKKFFLLLYFYFFFIITIIRRLLNGIDLAGKIFIKQNRQCIKVNSFNKSLSLNPILNTRISVLLRSPTRSGYTPWVNWRALVKD